MKNKKESRNLSMKETSKSLFSCILKNQERKKLKIANKNSSYNKCTIILIIFGISIAVLSSIVLCCFNDKINTECGMRLLLFLFFGSFLFIFILLFLSLLKEIFNSVLRFIFYGACIFFIVGLCFYALLLVITRNIIIPYYIMIFLMALLWSYISTLDDLEVAKLGNSIISAIVTLILGFTDNLKGTILFVKPATDDSKIISLIEAITLNENAWKIVLFPFVAATLIGLISCDYKEYWIKRNKEVFDDIKKQAINKD